MAKHGTCSQGPFPEYRRRSMIAFPLVTALVLVVVGIAVGVGALVSTQPEAAQGLAHRPSHVPPEWVWERRAMTFDHMFREDRSERSPGRWDRITERPGVQN